MSREDRLRQLMIIIRNRGQMPISELKQTFGADTDKLVEQAVQKGWVKVMGGVLIKVEEGPWG